MELGLTSSSPQRCDSSSSKQLPHVYLPRRVPLFLFAGGPATIGPQSSQLHHTRPLRLDLGRSQFPLRLLLSLRPCIKTAPPGMGLCARSPSSSQQPPHADCASSRRHGRDASLDAGPDCRPRIWGEQHWLVRCIMCPPAVAEHAYMQTAQPCRRSCCSLSLAPARWMCRLHVRRGAAWASVKSAAASMKPLRVPRGTARSKR